MTAAPYRLPFGKYRGINISEVPDRALEYYLAWDGLRAEARTAIEAERTRRAGGGPTHPSGAGTVVPEGVKARGHDLIAAGLTALEKAHAARPAQLAEARQAAELLRGWLRGANDADTRASRDEEVPF